MFVRLLGGPQRRPAAAAAVATVVLVTGIVLVESPSRLAAGAAVYPVPVTGARIRSAWHLRSTYFLAQRGAEAMLYPPVPAPDPGPPAAMSSLCYCDIGPPGA